MQKENEKSPEERLKAVLKLIQLRVQVRLNRTLTNSELAQLAGVGDRSFGDWMRGSYAPAGTNAILQLLSLLDESDVFDVLNHWRSTATGKRRSASNKAVEKSTKSQRRSDTAASKKKTQK